MYTCKMIIYIEMYVNLNFMNYIKCKFIYIYWYTLSLNCSLVQTFSCDTQDKCTFALYKQICDTL